MNITKRTKSEGTTVYQFRVFLSQSADGKQRTRSKTWQPPAGMTAKAAEKEAKRQAVIFENEVKQGRAALDARTKLSDVAREYIRNTEMEESARFIRAVMREKDIRVKTALLILIYLGLRKGELCGLTWSSVDLGKGIVHVAQQLKEKSGEGLILGKLKTKESKADLPLSPMLAEVLAEYRQWWNEHKAMYGDAWRGEWECLFVGDDGTPLNPSTINEWLDKLTERNGLPHVTVHSLRHLCATLLIRTHADPKTVQTILRHANVSTTLNIYAKVFDSTQMEAIGRVQASLENMLKESCSSSAQV